MVKTAETDVLRFCHILSEITSDCFNSTIKHYEGQRQRQRQRQRQGQGQGQGQRQRQIDHQRVTWTYSLINFADVFFYLQYVRNRLGCKNQKSGAQRH